MKELPKRILNNVDNYYKYSQKAEQARIEIEEWFIKQGMHLENDTDYPITDTLIDLSVEGDIGGTILILKQVLNEL